MKKFTLPIVLILLTSLIPDSHAAERIAAEIVSGPAEKGAAPSDAFSMMVTGDGKLIAKPGRVFTDGGDYRGISLPYLLSSPRPIVYPRWAIRQGWQGKLLLAIEIRTDGSVGRYNVLRSTGYRILDEEATRAVRSWKFYPAMKNGKPTLTCIEIPIVFHLGDE